MLIYASRRTDLESRCTSDKLSVISPWRDRSHPKIYGRHSDPVGHEQSFIKFGEAKRALVLSGHGLYPRYSGRGTVIQIDRLASDGSRCAYCHPFSSTLVRKRRSGDPVSGRTVIERKYVLFSTMRQVILLEEHTLPRELNAALSMKEQACCQRANGEYTQDSPRRCQ